MSTSLSITFSFFLTFYILHYISFYRIFISLTAFSFSIYVSLLLRTAYLSSFSTHSYLSLAFLSHSSIFSIYHLPHPLSLKYISYSISLTPLPCVYCYRGCYTILNRTSLFLPYFSHSHCHLFSYSRFNIGTL